MPLHKETHVIEVPEVRSVVETSDFIKGQAALTQLDVKKQLVQACVRGLLVSCTAETIARRLHHAERGQPDTLQSLRRSTAALLTCWESAERSP